MSDAIKALPAVSGPVTLVRGAKMSSCGLAELRKHQSHAIAFTGFTSWWDLAVESSKPRGVWRPEEEEAIRQHVRRFGFARYSALHGVIPRSYRAIVNRVSRMRALGDFAFDEEVGELASEAGGDGPGACDEEEGRPESASMPAPGDESDFGLLDDGEVVVSEGAALGEGFSEVLVDDDEAVEEESEFGGAGANEGPGEETAAEEQSEAPIPAVATPGRRVPGGRARPWEEHEDEIIRAHAREFGVRCNWLPLLAQLPGRAYKTLRNRVDVLEDRGKLLDRSSSDDGKAEGEEK